MIPPPPRSTLFPYTTLFRSFQVNSGQRRKAVIFWKDNVEPFAKEFMRQTVTGRNRQREKCEVDDASLDSIEQLAGHFLRSEEHTSELQSLRHLVCRLLLEKK